MSDTPAVLVVGAGPVGMVVACELLRQGVTVRLVDKEPAPPPAEHSRGILIWPRSLEVLRRIGVADRMADVGLRTPGVDYLSEGRLLGTAHVDRLTDTPYPFVLSLPQWETEAILAERLPELGGTIERGLTLEDLITEDDRPRARLLREDGGAEWAEARYVVGAAGPGSTVRRMLGIGFAGFEARVTYETGDVPIHGLASANTQYHYSRHGALAVIPLRDGHFRLGGNVQPPDGDGPPSRAFLENLVRRRTRTRATLGEPIWSRWVRPRVGLADKLHSGRCFLAGDSAHVISPIGGQGMNLGFQDAVNLGWRLGGVLTGRHDAGVLEAYHAERSPAATRMSRITARQVQFAGQRGIAGTAVRNTFVRAASAAGQLQRIVTPMFAQFDVDYGTKDTSPVPHRRRNPALPGQRVQQ